MVTLKKVMMRLLLIAEMITFGYIYVCGKNGLQALYNHENMVMNIKKDIMSLDGEVALLEKEINVWQFDDFYKEKIAREQLQMARKGDELFYIGT